jgi:hypothetical protein
MDGKVIAVIGIIFFVAMLVAIAPLIKNNIAASEDVRACSDAAHPYECLDNDDGLINWCSNESDGTVHCMNASLPIYNTTTQLCTNASGVHVVNGSATSVCDSFGWSEGIVAYENKGLSTTEGTLLSMVVLLLICGCVYAVAMKMGLMKAK